MDETLFNLHFHSIPVHIACSCFLSTQSIPLYDHPFDIGQSIKFQRDININLPKKNTSLFFLAHRLVAIHKVHCYTSLEFL